MLRDLVAGPDDIIEPLHAIECRNWPRRDWEASQATIDALLAVAPRLGMFPLVDAAVDLCRVWPAESDPPPPLTGTGAGPILVVGITGDVPTPLKSSRGLAERLEEGVLLIVEANQHGAYWVSPDKLCVIETVDLQVMLTRAARVRGLQRTRPHEGSWGSIPPCMWSSSHALWSVISK